MTNPHAEWLAKLADFIRDVLSPSEYQRLKFCAEMLEALDGRPAEPGEQLRCSCIWFTREGAVVTQHWKDDPQCPAHGERIRAATVGLTLTGLPTKSPAEPGVVQRICHALTQQCVMVTDPERKPCTPENCAAMKAALKSNYGLGCATCGKPFIYNKRSCDCNVAKSEGGLVPLKEGPHDEIFVEGVKWLDSL